VFRANFLSLVCSVIVSFLGPVYLAYSNARYSAAVVWALACALCWVLVSYRAAFLDAKWLSPFSHRSTVLAALVAIFAFVFVAGDSLAYLLARSISNGGLIGQPVASAALCQIDCGR
jgi:hypothetical protein